MNGLDLEEAEYGFFTFSWVNLSPRDRAKVLTDAPSTV